MTILTLQKRIAERGRIRFGEKRTETKRRKDGTEYEVTYPTTLDRPRVTSPDVAAIARIAEVYGGEVKSWASPSGQQWQVVVETDLRIGLLPVENLYSQHFEHWSTGGCDRRCDGVTESLSGKPCFCQAQGLEGTDACKPITRAAVVILGIGGFGTWRVETGSFYAAVEMGAVLDVARMAIANGMHVTGTLAIEHRRVVRPGPDGKPQTRQFVVPVIRPDIDIEMLTDGTVAPALNKPVGRGRLSPGERVPDERPALPVETGGIPGADGPAELPEPPPTQVLISDNQRRRLFATAKESGVDEAALRSIIGEHNDGNDSTKDIPRSVYDEIVAAVEANKSGGGSDGSLPEDGVVESGLRYLPDSPIPPPWENDPDNHQPGETPPIPGQEALA